MKWTDDQIRNWATKQTLYPNSKTKIVRGSPDFLELFNHAKKLGYNLNICKNKVNYRWVMASKDHNKHIQCKKCCRLMDLFIVHDEDSDYCCEYCRESCKYKYMCTRCRYKVDDDE